MKIIKHTELINVRVGDEILGYGTVTAVNPDGRLQTDTGYTMLSFPEGRSVPVISKKYSIVE